MKLKFSSLFIALTFANPVYSDSYLETLYFADGSTASLTFSFDLGTAYFTNVHGLVSGSPDKSANGSINDELGTYTHLPSYTPETLATLNTPEIPGKVFALFNSNNATAWQTSTAIFEYFLVENGQLLIDTADLGLQAADLYYPDLGYPAANLSSTQPPTLLDTTNPTPQTQLVPIPEVFTGVLGAVLFGITLFRNRKIP